MLSVVYCLWYSHYSQPKVVLAMGCDSVICWGHCINRLLVLGAHKQSCSGCLVLSRKAVVPNDVLVETKSQCLNLGIIKTGTVQIHFNKISYLEILTILHNSFVRVIYGGLLWNLNLISLLFLSLQCCVQYPVLLDYVITRRACIAFSTFRYVKQLHQCTLIHFALWRIFMW